MEAYAQFYSDDTEGVHAQLPPFRTMGRTATSTELLPLKTRLPTTAPSIMLVLGPSQLSP